MPKKRKISFVIPVFNEEKSLAQLSQEIMETVEKDLTDFTPEIIFIDDGSSDGSLDVIRELRKTDYRIQIISFRTNLGKAAALSEGFRKSTGEIIVTLDADLHDNPSNIKNLIDKLD